jgi:hypothetical protein
MVRDEIKRGMETAEQICSILGVMVAAEEHLSGMR